MREGISKPIVSLRGEVIVPGDKSISHRVILLGGLAVGETQVDGLLEGQDVLRTVSAMRAMGAEVEQIAPGNWRITGVGIGGLAEPYNVLDMGNAGTGARLLMGMLAGHNITGFLTGDVSLRSRPMARVAVPLEEMGARFVSREGGRLPMAVIGSLEPTPISYTLPVPSAQVKSAILLAGLSAPGQTTVIEPEPTRDHTERMMQHFGAEIQTEMQDGGSRRITLTGQPELIASGVSVPGDISSAAFPLVAALIVQNAEIVIPNIGLNLHRSGLLECLREMGAEFEAVEQRELAGEPVADLIVRNGGLKGIIVPRERAPSMIDEYPILAVAAAFAKGETRMCGLSELRLKESDRLTAIRNGLRANGVGAEISGNDLIIDGPGGCVPGGGSVEAQFDHRIAMSFLTMGLAAEKPIAIDDVSAIDTSFPNFIPSMNGLGADIEVVKG